jgi:A/G-specific adenine glycosylase
LTWYADRRRSLPWRDRPEPYAVWVAEIMAQQTRLETMLPYWERWMRRFPDIPTLAAARQQDVLNAWEGLGYYSRARNLHAAARRLVADFNGQLPRDLAPLRSLPGIGPYTAGAIASVAFGQDEPIVDGNIIRVLARVFNVEEVVGTSAATRRFWDLARQQLPAGRAADYNQALMDLGASLCAPRNPDCGACPISTHCEAYALGIQNQRPVRAAKSELPVRHYAAAVLRRGDAVLLLQRPDNGLLAGMWEFPNLQVTSSRAGKAGLRRALAAMGLETQLGNIKMRLEHTYSHFQARLRTYPAQSNGHRRTPKTERPHAWVPIIELGEYPMGKLDRQIADSLQSQ